MLPWHIRVAHALQHAYRNAETQRRTTQKKVFSTVLDEDLRYRIRVRVIGGRREPFALLRYFSFDVFIQTLPQQGLGKVRRGRDQQQSRYARRALERAQQRDPCSHARSDEDLRTLGTLIDHRQRVLAPTRD